MDGDLLAIYASSGMENERSVKTAKSILLLIPSLWKEVFKLQRTAIHKTIIHVVVFPLWLIAIPLSLSIFIITSTILLFCAAMVGILSIFVKSSIEAV
jgi:hypothetical protein